MGEEPRNVHLRNVLWQSAHEIGAQLREMDVFHLHVVQKFPVRRGNEQTSAVETMDKLNVSAERDATRRDFVRQPDRNLRALRAPL